MKKPKVEFILGPIFIMSAYLDMIKDSVLLYYLAKLSGGFRSVVNNFHKFPSVVSNSEIVIHKRRKLIFFYHLDMIRLS